MGKSPKRRQLIAGLGMTGVAGLAGCIGDLRERVGGAGEEPSPNGGQDSNEDESENENENEEEDEDENEFFHSGETIPTYPYGDVDFEPLESRPDPEAENPVLTHESIDPDDFEGEISFVADPFIFVEEDEWHMFFEVLERGHGGVITHAESRDRGLTWEHTGIALREEWHLANPHVFKWNGEYYMTTHALPGSRPPILYKSNAFPHEWYPVVDGIFDQREYDHEVTDHLMFRWDDRWWDLAGGEGENTYLYYSDQLETNDWTPHENNPVVEDRPSASRPSGRPIVLDDRIFIPFQQIEELYGESIQGYWITELGTDTYEDEHIGTVIEGTGRYTAEDEPAWNSLRMHHYDPWYLGEDEGWRIAVDGGPVETEGPNWAIGIYGISE